MNFYQELLKLFINKYIKKYKTGTSIKIFCENMGIVYIKLAQILSTQNFGELFTEDDRILLSSICDNSKPIPFDIIKNIIEEEYKCPINEIFLSVNPNPIGAASISQVHKAKLLNGEEIALKIKRKDITNNMEFEIKRIKKLMYKYGKIFKFGNFSGGEKALNMYLKWIYEETDFINEIDNIKKYQYFANSVNDKIENNKKIVLPNLYEEYCTNNIIVMEYIPYKTINTLELNEENKEKIKIAINSFISNTFYAMFNNLPIIFHGDPHGGNIYIDDNGNIGFLDMGLLFQLSKDDVLLTKDFFFAAYTRNYEKMYDMVIPYGNINDNKKTEFKNEVKQYCDNLVNKPLTSYFIDLMNICLKYEICPPDFLFYMVKTFICLGGINDFTENLMSGNDLLKDQVIEYYISDLLKNGKSLVQSSVDLVPSLLLECSNSTPTKFLTKSLLHSEVIYNNLNNFINSLNRLNDVINPSNNSDMKRKRNY